MHITEKHRIVLLVLPTMPYFPMPSLSPSFCLQGGLVEIEAVAVLGPLSDS